MQLSGKLFWIPANFQKTTGKLFLVNHFLQLEVDFVAAQVKPLTGDFCNSRENYGNFNFPAWLFKGNKAYLSKFIRSKSDPFVEAVKLTDGISENVVQVLCPSGWESTVSARDLTSSSECYSDTALTEQQAVVSQDTKNKKKS